MGNGVGGHPRWHSEPDLTERRRQQLQQASRSPAATAYPVSTATTAQTAGRRKTKNPVLRAIRAVANAPKKIGRAAGRSQQPPPLPPRAGRPPPPLPLPQQRGTTLGYMPERAFALDQPQAGARPVQELSSSGLSSSVLTLPTADDRTSPVPAPLGGRYLSQSCSNLVYGQQNNLYPPLSSLNTIEQENGSDSDVDGGEPRPEQPVYCAVGAERERESPRSGRNDEVDNEMPLYADLDEMQGLNNQQQGTDIRTDPRSERLSVAVRAAARARTMSPLPEVRQAQPSAPPMSSDYTLYRNADCSAVTNNRLGDSFIKSAMKKRQVYDDLIRKLAAFVCGPHGDGTHKAQTGGHGAGITPPTVATDVSLVQHTLKELYYLHAILHGHAAEDMSMDLLPEMGQKAYSFWESLHQVILKHHEELDRADAVCATEILRNPSKSNLSSVLEEHFKMQRFLLQRQRTERNAELDSVRRAVSANASWAAAATSEAPAAAAAAGLEVAAERLLRTRCEAPAHVNSGNAVVARGRAATAAAASAASRAPTDQTSASQVASTRAITALAGGGVTRALPNEYHKPHPVGAQQSVATPSSVGRSPADSLAPAAAARLTVSASVSAATPTGTVSPPTPDAAARADARERRPVEAVYSSLAAVSAPAKASAAPNHLDPPAALQVRAPSAPAAVPVAVDIRFEALSAAAVTTETVADVREQSSATSDSSVRRPLLVSCACQTDNDLSDGGSEGRSSSSSMARGATDDAIGAVHLVAKTAYDPASGDARDRAVLPEVASGTSVGVPKAVRRDAASNSRASDDDGSARGRFSTAAAVSATDNVAPPIAGSDNPLYMANSSEGCTARNSGSVSLTGVVAPVIGTAGDELSSVAAVTESGSRGRGRHPVPSPRIEAPGQSKLTPQQQQQQPAVEQLALTREQGEQTECAAAASKESQCTESGSVTATTATTAQRRVQEVAVTQLSTPSPPASARSTVSASGTSGGAGGEARPVDDLSRRETDLRAPKLFCLLRLALENLLEEGADSSGPILTDGLSVVPKLPPSSSPGPSPVAPIDDPETGRPLPLGGDGGGLPVERLHKEEVNDEPEQQQHQYAAYEAMSEDAHTNAEERLSTAIKSTTDDAATLSAGQSANAAAASAAARPADAAKAQPVERLHKEEYDEPEQQQHHYAAYEVMSEDAYTNVEEGRSTASKTTIDDAVTLSAGQSAKAAAASAAARPADTAKARPLSTRSTAVEPRLDATSSERATSPAGKDEEDDEPVYETLPCDEAPTAGSHGDASVSAVQRVALKPMEDVLRSSVGQQKPPPPLLPLPRVTGQSSSKNTAGAGDKSGRVPGKKKPTAKNMSATTSRYSLLTDDDDDEDGV